MTNKTLDKDEYYSWVAENDTYPEHSHKWIVELYTGLSVDSYFRSLGPFDTKEEAKSFAKDYKDKYTKPGFISRYSIEPLCEVL